MQRKVRLCNKSTITEAWAVLTGVSGPHDESEASTLEYIAKNNIDDLTKQPSLVIATNSNQAEVPAFWYNQYSWDEDKYRARFGHRYLSVHFVKQQDVPYKTFNISLEKNLKNWLDFYSKTIVNSKNPYPIEKVNFGYINMFEFPSNGFDLSKYFKINFGVDLPQEILGLETLNISFTTANPKVNVHIAVMPHMLNRDLITLRTLVEAYEFASEIIYFKEKSKLVKQIKKVKEQAKKVFFNLATEETHVLMEAEYVKKKS